MGMKVEREHDDVTHGDLKTVRKIVDAHLKELPDYYTRLKKMESEGDKKMTNKKILKKVAGLGSIGATVGNALSKIAPKLTTPLVGAAKTAPKLLGTAAGVGIGAGTGMLASNKNDSTGKKIGLTLAGAAAGGLGGALGKNKFFRGLGRTGVKPLSGSIRLPGGAGVMKL